MLLIVLTSCVSNEKRTDTILSPMFEVGPYTMVGEENRVGFIYSPFVPNQKQKYMWHFWGKPDELEGHFVVRATNIETNQEVVVTQAASLGPANNRADAHLPTLMALPTSGEWELKAYIGEQHFGTIIVKTVKSYNL